MVGLREFIGLGNLLGGPLGGAPVQHLALAHQVVHCPHGLADGGVRIRAVAEIQVQVIHLQALQRLVAGLGDVLATEPELGGGGILVGAKKHLG